MTNDFYLFIGVQKKFLRGLVLRMMVKFNHPEVVEQCKIMFEAQFGDEPEPVPVDLRYIVYKSVVAHGDDTMHKRIIRVHDTQVEPSDWMNVYK